MHHWGKAVHDLTFAGLGSGAIQLMAGLCWCGSEISTVITVSGSVVYLKQGHCKVWAYLQG